MNRSRLRYLANQMLAHSKGRILILPGTEKVPASFDLKRFVVNLVALNWVAFRRPEMRGCGTAVCACGFAGYLPKFQKMGLSVDPDHDEITYQDEVGADAAKKFFGIDAAQFDHLFVDTSYSGRNPLPATVARRILAFAA